MSSPITQTESDPTATATAAATAVQVQPASPRLPGSGGTPTAGAQRKIGIAVDLSDESAFAIKWAVQNYLRPGDAVVLVHVSPTRVLYGADWGAVDATANENDNDEESESKRKAENDLDAFMASKAKELAEPLERAEIPYKIHVVKDHDMKERLCLEVERLGVSALITGSRGIGATKSNLGYKSDDVSNGRRLGSVSDYCVHHCVCPVIVVRASSFSSSTTTTTTSGQDNNISSLDDV